MRIADINLKPINRLQQEIMVFIDNWAREEKTPIPRSEIMEYMKSEGKKSWTIINALNVLLRKGYIREAVMTTMRNRTFYVQLRGI